MANENEKVCFVIAPIGESGSNTRKQSDQILNHVIRPVVATRGYRAIRADEIAEPGIITSQIIQHVVDAALVIADLSGQNPNVYYELAVRHATQKPFIQIIRKGESIPFDVFGTRTVFIDTHDLDSVEQAKQEMADQITTIESNSTPLDTPISVAMDLQQLRQSDDPTEQFVVTVLSELSAQVRETVQYSTEHNDLVMTHLSRQLDDVLVSIKYPGNVNNIDPRQIVGMVNSTVTGDEHLVAVPVLLSFIRQDFPWVYELGMEGYRQNAMGNTQHGYELYSAVLGLLGIIAQQQPARPGMDVYLKELERALSSG